MHTPANMDAQAQQLIDHLQLKPHPEGGYYAETYRATEVVQTAGGLTRSAGTAIYFLLQGREKSHFHRIASDELWFYHQGQPLEIVSIREGQLHTVRLGSNLAHGESLQATIPAHTWFAARVAGGAGYALVSCTVAPGFDFADFELAERGVLTAAFPDLAATIEVFTRK